MPTYESLPSKIEAMVFDGTYAGHNVMTRWMREQPAGNAAYRGIDILSKPERLLFTFAVAKNGGAIATLEKGDAIIAEPDGSGYYPCLAAVFSTRWKLADG